MMFLTPLRIARSAFTLMEVLVAMAIFAVGAIAVAAIFPTALVLQRETVNDVMAAHVTESADATLLMKGFDGSTGWTDSDVPGAPMGSTPAANQVRVAPVPPGVAGTATTPPTGMFAWPLRDRSFPSIETNVEARSMYVVPLFLDMNDDPYTPAAGPLPLRQNRWWAVFYFILRREDTADYSLRSYPPMPTGQPTTSDELRDDGTIAVPGLDKLDGLTHDVTGGVRDVFVIPSNGNAVPTGATRRPIEAGELILDRFGLTYRVIEVEDDRIRVDRAIRNKPFTGYAPDEIWYAPGGAAKEIRQLVSTAENRLVRD